MDCAIMNIKLLVLVRIIMTSKKDVIIQSADTVFNAEGYISPSIDKIVMSSNVSKMTFYKYFPDKESLIIEVLEKRKTFFIHEIKNVIDSAPDAKGKLRAVFDFYQKWFDSRDFNGCMFERASLEYGSMSPMIRYINDSFKQEMCRLLADVIKGCLRPEPAERCALTVMMMIDGAIAAVLCPSMTREFPPLTLIWSATKSIIFNEGGEL